MVRRAGLDLPTLVLYGRTYCHLCHEMELSLRSLQDELGFDLQLIDVDSDPVLSEAFDELVPVLVADGVEICHYHIDEAAVRERVQSSRALSGKIR